MDSEDDDMFDVFDQPAPKALEDDGRMVPLAAHYYSS
jgi:hypothetical protein